MSTRIHIAKAITPEQAGWRGRIAHFSPTLQAAFLAWVADLQALLPDGDVASALITRSVAAFDHALQAVAFKPSLRAPTLREADQAFEDVVRRLSTDLHLSFNLHDPNFDRAVRAHEARLVREVTAETRRAIVNIVERGYASGVHPTLLAPQIREMVGLTSRQAGAVMNFAEAQRKAGRSPEVVADRAIRYAQRMRTRRAKTIAVTETAKAATAGRLAGWKDAAAQGLFNAATAEMKWSAVQEDPTEICGQLNGSRVPLGETWDGLLPGDAHPLCRCAPVLVLDH